MRIAIVGDLAPGGAAQGGVQNATSSLVTALLASGEVDVTVIAPDHHTDAQYMDTDYPWPVQRVPMLERVQVLRGYRPWIAAVRRTLELIDPDIAQGQGLMHHGNAAAAWRGCPTIVSAHGNPLADSSNRYPVPLAAALAPVLRQAVRRTERGADIIANVTPDWRVNLVEEPQRSAFIPNPVSQHFFDAPASAFIPQVHYFGGPRAIKGGDLLLEAWPSVRQKVPDARLRIYGAGPSPVSPMDAVELSPALDNAGVAEAMAKGGVVVVPSRYEVSPIVISEAWAVGVPVVATRVGGVSAMAEGAALVAEPTARSIAEALIQMLTDAEVRATLVSEASRRADLQRPEAVADAYLALYRELAQ
ncbi:MAG: glycosyltransferase family 4 protein [Actinomycetota bacterium]|nr:glycosyltransferase family 4 protein [Actinomycetota bacterium]